jgi:Arc/MetJ-type ribon-helix-helix transcriptional regulator
MPKPKMKRVNIIIEDDLYEKARAVAFVRRQSISEVIRKALRQWMTKNLDKKSEIVLSAKEEERLLKIMETEELVPLEEVKKSLGL